jgi:hypothetical protein
MEMETNIDEYKGIEMMESEEGENVKTNGEVNIEEELICSLNEIKNIRKNNLKLKGQLEKHEEENRDSR